jgi:hypothetical protein
MLTEDHFDLSCEKSGSYLLVAIELRMDLPVLV